MPAPATRLSNPPVAAAPARAALPVKKTAPLPTPHLSGPRLFQVMRVGLVVWTLVSTVLCLASILASQSHQEASAGALIHAQDLRDLRSEAAQAQATALATLAGSQSSQADLWTSYVDSRAQIDLLLLGSAASAVQPADLGHVADTLRTWQDNIAVAHHDALGPGMAAGAVTDITASYTDVMSAIATELAATAGQESSSTPFIVLSLLASVLGGLGFVVVSVLTARRSHRVINIGLSIGLIAIIAAIVAVGVYASRSSEISVTDTRIAALSQAESDTWDILTNDTLSVLDPASWQSHVGVAGSILESMQDNLNALSPTSGLTAPLSDLAAAQSAIASAEDTDARSALVTDLGSWQTTASALGAAIDAARPDSADLVVPALGYVVTVATCCVIAIIATLAGIHARTKEYS